MPFEIQPVVLDNAIDKWTVALSWQIIRFEWSIIERDSDKDNFQYN